MLLVYTYGTTHSPASGDKALKTMTQQQLDKHLTENPQLQVTKKSILGQHYVDIYQKDLYTASQKHKYSNMANYEANLASVHVGFKSLIHRELVILSENKDASDGVMWKGAKF